MKPSARHLGRALPAVRLLSYIAGLVLRVLRKNIQLERSEARHRALFELSKIPMLLIDSADGAIVQANAAAASFYGYTRQALEQLNIADINQLAPQAVQAEMLLAQQEKRDCFYFTHRLASGETRAVEVRSGPLRLEGRDLLYSVIHDISERRATEVALASETARLFALLETASDGIHILDEEGRLVQFSHSFASMLGYSDAEMRQRNVRDWDAQIPKEELIDFMRRLTRAPSQFETRHRRRDGALLDVEVNAKGIEIDGRTYLYASARDITQRKRAELTLRESQERLRLAQEGAKVGVWELDLATGATYWSDECERLYGMPPDTLRHNDTWRARVHPDDLSRIDAKLQNEIARGQDFEVDFRVRLDSGETRWLLSKGRAQYDAAGVPVRLAGINMDVTERKLSEEKLRRAASVFTHAREGIMITALDGSILEVNDTFSRITGYARVEVLGQNPRMMRSGHQQPAFYASMWRELLSTGGWAGEVWNRRKGGEVYAEFLTISAVRDGAGQPREYLAMFSDITAQKQHQQQLERIAHYDALTGLPNRVLLADRLNQAMAQATRREQMLAVVYLDLDGFKRVNDSHGHDVGDLLLNVLAVRMRQALRDADTFGRIGGDEFVAVLSDIAAVEASVPLLERLLAAASEPVHVRGLVLHVTASLGVAFYPQAEGVDADQLLRQADQSMYQAKLSGKNRYQVFDAEFDRSVRGHHESLDSIRRGLKEREFVLFYQPKVNMRTGQVVGAEALIRWQHPARGLLSPAQFLPAIEDHPLSIEVGDWVIATALAQIEAWQAQGLEMAVSVNVGALQLQQGGFVENLSALLRAHPRVRPGQFELEVLETNALKDITKVSQLMLDCKKIGVGFALDDFGTGYSSLTYLKRLPIEMLKIDQSFVFGMLEDRDDQAILQGVLGLARAFRIRTIAEGVESVPHGVMLLSLGCELAQGYGIARPMPGADLPAWCASWRPDPSWRAFAATEVAAALAAPG